MTSKDYCIVRKDVFHNKNLSLEAKGIYALMMSIDKDEFDGKEILNLVKEDEEIVCKAVEELQSFGYITFEI